MEERRGEGWRGGGGGGGVEGRRRGWRDGGEEGDNLASLRFMHASLSPPSPLYPLHQFISSMGVLRENYEHKTIEKGNCAFLLFILESIHELIVNGRGLMKQDQMSVNSNTIVQTAISKCSRIKPFR